MAEEATSSGNWSLAADCWNEIFIADGGRGLRPCAETARALLELDQAEGAQKLVELGLRHHPRNPWLLELEGQSLAQQGFRRAAETCYEEALESDPDRPSALLSLARLRLALGLEKAAVEPLERALALGEDSAEVHLLLGRACQSAGWGVRAFDAYGAAFEREPGCVQDLIRASALGSHLTVRASRPDALEVCLEWLHKAVESDPQSGVAHFQMAVLSEHLGRSEDAIVAYRRAVELDPSDLSALTNLAILYSRERDEANTREIVARALDLEKNRFRRSKLEKLLEPFEQASKADPD